MGEESKTTTQGDNSTQESPKAVSQRALSLKFESEFWPIASRQPWWALSKRLTYGRRGGTRQPGSSLLNSEGITAEALLIKVRGKKWKRQEHKPKSWGSLRLNQLPGQQRLPQPAALWPPIDTVPSNNKLEDIPWTANEMIPDMRAGK